MARRAEASAQILSENSPVQMEQAIAQLLAGRTPKEVAENLGIPASRISRWYRESEDFQTRLAEVESRIVESIRTHVVQETTEGIIDLLPEALKRIEAMLDSDKDSVVLAAANSVFRLSGATQKQVVQAGPSPEQLIGALGGRSPGDGD